MSIINYFKETKGELKHVNWPTRQQVAIFTVAVIILSLILAYALGLFDFAFAQAWKKLLGY